MPSNSSIMSAWERHNQNRHPIWNRWRRMIQRCHSAKSGDPHYQKLGIEVCDRWRASFDAFIADMGEPPSLQHTIERIDNNRGYEPSNCRWATMTEQAANRSKSFLYYLNGETRSVREWAEMCGVSEQQIRIRLRRGWSLEKALTTKGRQKKKTNQSPNWPVGLFSMAIY